MTVRSLGQLTIDMLLKTGSLETDMGRAARIAEKGAKQIQKAMQGAAIGVAKELAAVAGLSYSIAQAWQGFQGAISAADKVDELSARLGISTEKLSEYRYAAQLTGSNLDALTGSLAKFSKNMAEAQDPNSKQAKLFKTLGIEVVDATGRLRQAQSVLPEVMDRFKGLTNETLEAATAMELFGKSGSELLEFLNLGSSGLEQMGARARELGGIIDSDTAAAAAKFRDRTDEMTLAMEGLYLQIAADMLPAMTQLTEGFTDFVKDGERVAEVTNTIKGTFEVLGGAVDFVAPLFKAIDDVIQGLSMSVVGLDESLRGLLDLNWDKVKRGWEVAGQGSDLFYLGEEQARLVHPGAYGSEATDDRPVNQRRRSGRSRRGGAPMNMTDGPEKADYERALRDFYSDEEGRADKARKAAEARTRENERDAKQRADSLARYAAQAEVAAAALNGPYAEAVARADQQAKAWRKEVEAGNMSLASEQTLLKASAAELEKRRIELEKQQKAPQALLDTLSGELHLLGMIGPARERYQRQLQTEDDMRRAITDAIEAGNTALRDSPDMQQKLLAEARAFADWSMQVEEAAALAEQWAGVVVGGVEDAATAFSELIVDGSREFGDFWDDLKDIAKRGVADLIRQLLQQKIVLPIQAQILSGMSGQGGSGIWSELLGLFNGNGFSAAGQNAGNWASVFGGGNGGWISSIASLFGGGGATSMGAGNLWAKQAASGAGSLFNFGNGVGGLWGTGAGGAGAGAGAASGAAGALGSVASFMPWAALIMAGMKMADSAYKDGFGLQYQDKGDLLLRGNLMTGGLATPLMLDSMSLDKIGRMLGMSNKTAAIFSGSSLLGKAFGRSAPKVQGSGISGTYGFGGFDGSSWADVKQKGGWFRSDKRWTQWGAIQPEVDRAFDMAVDSVGKGVEILAKQIGVDVSEQLKNVKVSIGKLQLDSDPEKARQQIEKAIDDMVGNLTGQAVRTLGFGHLLDDGFNATEVMTTLSATINLVTGSAEDLGRALTSWELGNVTKGVEYFMELAEKNGTTLQEEMERVMGLLGNYSSLMTDVRGELMTAGLSEAQRAALDIEMTYRDQVKAANEYAKALGLSGARAEDLAKIEELRAVKMGWLQEQIERERNALLGDLAVSQYSPLNDREKLAESMKQLQAAVAAGDVSAASSLSQSVLGFGRNLYASGRDYNDLYDRVKGLIGGMGSPDLTMDDGTTMGDLADILGALPDNIARAIFAQASGATAPLPTGGQPKTPTTGGNGPVNAGGGGAGSSAGGNDLLTQIRDVLYRIADGGGRADMDRVVERLGRLNA